MLTKLEKVAIERRGTSIHALSSFTAVRLYEFVGYTRVCSHILHCEKEKVTNIAMNKSLKAFNNTN